MKGWNSYDQSNTVFIIEHLYIVPLRAKQIIGALGYMLNVIKTLTIITSVNKIMPSKLKEPP